MPRSRLEVALAEDCVQRCLGRLDAESRPSYLSTLKGWLLWLWRSPEWSGKSVSELLEWQENAKGRQRFLLVDAMTEWIQEKGGTYSSMITQVSHLRFFFTHNRVELHENRQRAT